MKYQNKPKFVEAVQWVADVPSFLKIKDLCEPLPRTPEWRDGNGLILHTCGCSAFVHPGDYVVKNSDGVICSWDMDIFEAAYEPSDAKDSKNDLKCESIAVEPCWQERMQFEYHDLKTRYEKLHRMITKYEAGTLDFIPKCCIDRSACRCITWANAYMTLKFAPKSKELNCNDGYRVN